jgi:putative transposase
MFNPAIPSQLGKLLARNGHAGTEETEAEFTSTKALQKPVSTAEVVATLRDEQCYLGSVSTFYRVLRQKGEANERRKQRTHPVYVKPELLATRPNQLWCWDISRLKGPLKWTYYYLYVLTDVYSRYVVGWMVATREDAELAKELILEACLKQGILPATLTIHSDRGSTMIDKSLVQFLIDVGVAKSHSRPHVSNDNPFSEAQFKTTKYRPDFPARFGSLEDATTHMSAIFLWYNTEHRHSGTADLTPAMLQFSQGEQVLAARDLVLLRAYQAHPERFVKKTPCSKTIPAAVWINPPAPTELVSAILVSGDPV